MRHNEIVEFLGEDGVKRIDSWSQCVWFVLEKKKKKHYGQSEQRS